MKTKFVSKYGKPITASRSAMRPTPITGQPNSLAQAQSQIQASPMPFQNPRGPVAPVESHQGFKQKQVHGRASSGGTRPGANTANAPRSAPMSDARILSGAGYKKGVNYANHPVHVQNDKSVRVMRGNIPGSKPLVDNSDVFSAASIRDWNKNARGL